MRGRGRRLGLRLLPAVAASLAALAAAGPAPAGDLVLARSSAVRAGFDEFGTLAYLAGPDGVNLLAGVTPSFYGGPFGADGPAWHPVGSGGQLVSLVTEDESTVRTVVRPFDIGSAWSLCECIVESTYRAQGNALWVTHTLRNARSDASLYPATLQELPALYSRGSAFRLFTYDGAEPWTNGGLREIATPWPLFTPGGPSWPATEHWAALVDGAGYGVGFFSPETTRFVGIPGRDGALGTNGYLTASAHEILDRDIVYEYRYALVVGTLAEIRGFAYANRPDDRPDWDFAGGREHWFYFNAADNGWPVSGTLKVRLEERDPMLWSPERAFRAEDVPRVYIRAAVHGVPDYDRGELFFVRAGEDFWPNGADRVDVPVFTDGLFHTYAADLSVRPRYTGLISRLRYDPVLDGRLGAWVELDYVSYKQRTQTRQVSLTLDGHLRARGYVTVEDVSPDCIANVPVIVQRLGRGGWLRVARTSTGRGGGYRVRLPDRPGRYRVRAPEYSPGERCLEAFAGSLVHRHRR